MYQEELAQFLGAIILKLVSHPRLLKKCLNSCDNLKMQTTSQEKVFHSIAVVIPAYRVSKQILSLISQIGPEISHIIVVDDNCPEKSGNLVLQECRDPRVQVLFNEKNLGVGGAVISGYRKALTLDSDLVVKLDGDGQMDPSEIPKLVLPLIRKEADYTKGNRFFNIKALGAMPINRIIGNAGLSFYSKMSSGYWSIFDPNNGFTAINMQVLSDLDLSKIDNRYFFESDMLFRLNLAKAVVLDVPMPAVYKDEKSNLSILKVLVEFPLKHSRNLLKRIFYNYLLREFSLASLNLLFGSLLVSFSLIFGSLKWFTSNQTGIPSGEGALILFTVSMLMGFQLLISFFGYDIGHEPKIPLGKLRENPSRGKFGSN